MWAFPVAEPGHVMPIFISLLQTLWIDGVRWDIMALFREVLTSPRFTFSGQRRSSQRITSLNRDRHAW